MRAPSGHPKVTSAEASELITLQDIAERFEVAPRTVTDRRWRKRAGLRVVRLGGKILGVRVEDLALALRRDF